MNLDYGDYVVAWRTGHFDDEKFLSAEAWGHMSPDMRAITINVLQHQQRVIRDRARANAQPEGDQPKTAVEIIW